RENGVGVCCCRSRGSTNWSSAGRTHGRIVGGRASTTGYSGPAGGTLPRRYRPEYVSCRIFAPSGAEGGNGMATAVGSTPQLKPNAVGLVPVLFQSITHMAPAAAVAFSIIFATPYAGGSTALAVALALVACLLVA